MNSSSSSDVLKWAHQVFDFLWDNSESTKKEIMQSIDLSEEQFRKARAWLRGYHRLIVEDWRNTDDDTIVKVYRIGDRRRSKDYWIKKFEEAL